MIRVVLPAMVVCTAIACGGYVPCPIQCVEVCNNANMDENERTSCRQVCTAACPPAVKCIPTEVPK